MNSPIHSTIEFLLLFKLQNSGFNQSMSTYFKSTINNHPTAKDRNGTVPKRQHPKWELAAKVEVPDMSLRINVPVLKRFEKLH